MAAKGKKDSIKEPSVVIRPLGGMGGLDNIHLALVVLVVVLMALLLAVAYTKPAPIIINSTVTGAVNCTYGSANGKCITPINTPAQIKQDAESFLASYNYLNTSLSLLPYISDVSRMNLSYNQGGADWYVSFPAVNPTSNTTFQVAMLINDRNTSQITPLIQALEPANHTTDFVVSKGVVQIAGQSQCSVQNPLQVYWFVDPYSPGGLSSLSTMVSLQNTLKSQISASVKILFTQYSQGIAANYGLNNSLALGSYLFCASNQSSFNVFVSRANQAYNGSLVPPARLASIANQSGLNNRQLSSCLSTAGTIINRQAVLAKYYNITSTPVVVTDCRYLSIPQTATDAIHYANSSLT